MSDMNLDLSTPGKARKALADLVSEQKRLKASNRDLRENFDAKASAVTKITQRLSELESQQSAYNGERGDGSMDKYVRRDGSIRMKGEATDEHAFMPGLLDDKSRSDWQQDFQQAVDDYNLCKAIRRNGEAPKAKARMQAIARKSTSPEVRRLFADDTNKGGEWIPDVMLPQLERNLTSQRRIASLFETVPMADKTVVLPYLTTGFRPYKKVALGGSDDPAQYTSSSMTTDNRTITATGLAVRAQVDADSSEDSILAALPLIRQELVTALVDGEEDGIINGDSTASHQDAIASWDIRSRWGTSGLGSSADHRRAWTGLRARSFDVSSTTTPAETFAGFMSIRRQLDAPHGVEGDCILITSPEVYLLTLINLEQVLDLSKFGPQYTALSGQLAQMGGMPVIVSDFVGADLAASGLYTGSGSVSTAIVCNRTRFKIGSRAGSAVELDKDISRGVYDIVATAREIFYTTDASTTKNVAVGIDLATS